MSHFQGMTLEWLGHATFLLRTSKGTTVLIDPWMESNPSHPKNWRAPDKIDAVLCTHAHMDHIGDAVSVWNKYKPTFIAVHELAILLKSKGIEQTIGMNMGGTVQFQDVAATLVEAHHSSSIEENGRIIYAGDPGGFVVRVENEPVLYHAGDTSLFSDMKLIRELYGPKIACLPIGDHFTMGPREAALAAEFLGCESVIPMHYGTFPVLTGTPTELRRYLTGKNAQVLELSPGVPLELSSGRRAG